MADGWKRVAVLSLLSLPAIAFARDGFPMPRDAAISQLVGSYSDNGCTPKMIEHLKISQSECSARSESAKKVCPALIAVGLPDRIDKTQLAKLVARAAGCHMKTMMGQTYDNAPWDRSAEDMLKQQSGG